MPKPSARRKRKSMPRAARYSYRRAAKTGTARRPTEGTRPATFMGLVGKVLPLTIKGQVEGHLTCNVNYRRERRPDDQDD
jgi:hypothetical protein